MQTLHYNYFLKKAPILKHKSPNEIYCYSNIPPLIEFTHRALSEFTIPENLKPGENYFINKEKRWNVKDGVCNFKRYIFPKNESRIKNFLLDVASYEICQSKNFEKKKDINGKDTALASELEKLSLKDDENFSKLKNKPRILCHNGLHNDIARSSKETYDLIYYQDQMIFSSQDRRTNQNNLVSYIGLKFEDLLCKVDKTDGRTHFKSLIEGNYGKWTYWSAVEIDALRKQTVEANEKKIENNVKCQDRYTEIKLRLVKGNNKHPFKSIRSTDEFLLYLKNSSRSSSFTIEKWVYQCYFGMSPYLVVGIRDDSFNVLAVQEIDVKKELIPFYKKHFSSSYKKFIRSVDKLDTVYDFIENFVKKNQGGRNVFQFAIKGSDDFEIKKITGQIEEQIFNNVLQPEFEEWRETGKDTISTSHLIRHMHPIND